MRQAVEAGVQAPLESVAPIGEGAVPLALGIPGVLALQRTAGNRRTTAMLLRQSLARGFAAHQHFIAERTALLGSLQPVQRRMEELTLQAMTEALLRDRRLADRELPIALHSRLARDVLRQAGGREDGLGPTEAAAPPPIAEQERRMAPYLALAEQLRSYRNRSERLVNEPWEQRVWLVRESAAVQDVMNAMASQLVRWATTHIREAHERRPEAVLHDIAADPEMQQLFRAAQLAPIPAEEHSTRADVAGWAIVGRLLWGFVPLLGDLTDLSEAVAGWDVVEQRRLTEEERAIMLLGALLPLVPGGALRRAGETVQTAAARLAGTSTRPVAEIERALRAAEAVSADQAAIRSAMARIRRGEHVAAAETERLREAARRVEGASGSPPPHHDPAAGAGGGGGQPPPAPGGGGAGGAGQPPPAHGGGAGSGGTPPPSRRNPAGAASPVYASVEQAHAAAVRALSGLRHSRPSTQPPLGREIRWLTANPGAGNDAIRQHVGTVWHGLQDPRILADVIADVWAEAHRVAPLSYTDAVVRLSERTGARVVTIAPNPSGQATGLAPAAFYDLYASVAQRFLDRNVEALHGATTHLIQDLAVDRALREAGVPLRAEQFRALLRDAQDRPGDRVATGDRLWRALWDAESPGAINDPESLMAQLRAVLHGLE